jgi:hypothetical protein
MIISQLVAPLLIRKMLLVTIAMVLSTNVVLAQKASRAKTTLEGQLVCSECWFEADRKTTAYGTPADIQCAADCAVKGIPPAVAVKQGKEFHLYLIEPGQFKQNSEEWITYIGKWVQVSGSVSSKKEKQYVAVDEIRVLTSSQENTQNAAVLGYDPDLRLSREDRGTELQGDLVHSLPQRNARFSCDSKPICSFECPGDRRKRRSSRR